MVDTQSNTYTPLEGRRPIDSPEVDNLPPRDANMCVYMGLVMAGIGFVLPYNSFIIASDFWQTRFPGRSVALDMSMTYIIVAFATVLLNNVFLSVFSFKVRILFGYMISLSTFLFVSICEVAVEMFSMQTAYAVNLVAVSLTAIGCTVQQSSFYGFASMFPKQYTQAVMTGESVAGFVVALTRILTKLVITNDRVSTFFFLLMSVCYIAASYAFHSMTINSPFVQYHTKQCARIVLRPDEDRSDGELSATKYGVLSLDGSATNSPLPTANQITSHSSGGGGGGGGGGMSFSNPVYELSNPSAGESNMDDMNDLTVAVETSSDATGHISHQHRVTTSQHHHHHQQTPSGVAYKVEHILTPGGCASSRFGDFKSGLDSRWRVAHAIYPYMVSIALAYCVTLSLYPGIETEIISCNLKSWMPVLLMFTFNSSDLIGKMIAIVPYNWTRRQLILLSGMRTGLIPLLLLCCAPRAQPVIAGEAAAFVFSAALGVTNGLAGSLPMMLAPAKVPATLKEVTGNMMTLSYNVGLTAGSLIGYVFESMLGPQLINPCPSYPYIPMPPTTSTTTIASSTVATTTISSMVIASSSVPTGIKVFGGHIAATAAAPTSAATTALSAFATVMAGGNGIRSSSSGPSTTAASAFGTAIKSAFTTAAAATTMATTSARTAATSTLLGALSTMAATSTIGNATNVGVAAVAMSSTMASLFVGNSSGNAVGFVPVEATTMRHLATSLYNVTSEIVMLNTTTAGN